MTTRQTRQSKTPAQRAQEAVDVAQRRVERIQKALTHQRDLVATYESDLNDAETRLEYAKKDPALTTQPDTTTTGATR